ncbi:L-fuconolactonase [Pedobacter sp. UYEF25]
MKLDSHQHFWKFDPIKDAWIDETMELIRRDFLPENLNPILSAHHFDGCIAVQADQSEEQNTFLLDLAKENSCIKGIVGWVDLADEEVEDRLEYYQSFPLIKGFRHVLQGETQRDFMLTPKFKRGIGRLEKHNFTYDILIFTDQIKHAEKLVSQFPNQKFVIDHMAKPHIKSNALADWKNDMTAIARHENVCCKISGLITEADWTNWQKADFIPYMDAVFEVFGTKRLLYGSDWPVCELAGGYEKALSIVEDYTIKLSDTEQEDIFGNNAVKFYSV